LSTYSPFLDDFLASAALSLGWTAVDMIIIYYIMVVGLPLLASY